MQGWRTNRARVRFCAMKVSSATISTPSARPAVAGERDDGGQPCLFPVGAKMDLLKWRPDTTRGPFQENLRAQSAIRDLAEATAFGAFGL
jgi:hypothetical protein